LDIAGRKGEIIDEAVRNTKPMKALEFGCDCGYSSVRIARLLPKGGKLISIDKNKKH
jgi:catechol O-methyltransferase